MFMLDNSFLRKYENSLLKSIDLEINIKAMNKKYIQINHCTQKQNPYIRNMLSYKVNKSNYNEECSKNQESSFNSFQNQMTPKNIENIFFYQPLKQAIQSKDQTIKSSDYKIIQMNKTIKFKSKNQTIHQKDQQIKLKDQTIKKQDQQINQKDHIISKMLKERQEADKASKLKTLIYEKKLKQIQQNLLQKKNQNKQLSEKLNRQTRGQNTKNLQDQLKEFKQKDLKSEQILQKKSYQLRYSIYLDKQKQNLAYEELQKKYQLLVQQCKKKEKIIEQQQKTYDLKAKQKRNQIQELKKSHKKKIEEMKTKMTNFFSQMI